jgi:poly(U)-specific endoribonuclease
MADIYETIWNSTGSHVRVSRPGQEGEEQADVVVEQQAKWRAGDCTSAQARPRPLFGRVNEAILQEPSFAAFSALLNNYTARERQPELDLDDPDHGAEVDAFLDAIWETEPMRLARTHIRTELHPEMTEEELRDKVRDMWFEPYTNRFSQVEPFCVGFEHVFVGEAGQPGNCKDSVGGYHSWVKYYLDQKAGKTSYLGHDYRDEVADEGVAENSVATVVMTWKPDVDEGGPGVELLKRPGGFFVGTRPECEIALGTIGLFEVLANRFDTGSQENHRTVRLGNSSFDLVLHPETVRRSPQQRGDHIRTFYPKFRGSTVPPDVVVEPDVPPLPTQPHNDGGIRILRALPNPPGPETSGEWVEIRNVNPDPLDLTGWRLLDAKGRPEPLSGSIASQETRRIEITRTDPNGMQLANSGGWIMLYEGTNRRAAVQYGRAGEGRVFEFPQS